jgi:hypothetical protein
MKKILLAPLVLIALVISCKKTDAPPSEVEEQTEAVAGTVHRTCVSHEVLEEQLRQDPGMRARRQSLEEATQTFMKLKKPSPPSGGGGGGGGTGGGGTGTLVIPVVVNVLYRTSTENISDAQIQSQIDVLNRDFANTNTDGANTPAEFQDERAAVGIKFVLANINRKSSTKNSWSITREDMKHVSTGGIDATDPANNLNIWVVNKMTYAGSTILGYAQFPGGPAATDGVVIGYNFFGSTGVVSAPYNLGRTATHEVGHWMNLYHIWGDATCGSDGVDDTPQHNTNNYGCPTYPHLSTCSGKPVEMTMNYMDYTDDACMYMFTNGQAARMNATFFAANAPRASFTN